MGKDLLVGSVSGYVAQSDPSQPSAAVIVVHEWWGLDVQTRSIADRFAALGYFAFAPDLYHGELAQLGDSETAARLTEKYGARALEDLAAAFDALLAQPGCDGRIGGVGFCFGGRMALTLALSRPLSVVCTFYGGRMQILFDQLHQLRSPVLGLFGDQDRSIPVGTVQEFDKILDRVGVEHEIMVYPNSGHAFFRDSDPTVYRPAAAADAWSRVTAFFSHHMPPVGSPS